MVHSSVLVAWNNSRYLYHTFIRHMAMDQKERPQFCFIIPFYHLYFTDRFFGYPFLTHSLKCTGFDFIFLSPRHTKTKRVLQISILDPEPIRTTSTRLTSHFSRPVSPDLLRLPLRQRLRPLLQKPKGTMELPADFGWRKTHCLPKRKVIDSSRNYFQVTHDVVAVSAAPFLRIQGFLRIKTRFGGMKTYENPWKPSSTGSVLPQGSPLAT